MLFHLICIMLGLALFFFIKSDVGYVDKKNILKDKESNVIGHIVDMMDSRMFEKIEEKQESYCFECLTRKGKHEEHCKKCN